jgi:vacuolar-type H+-ATPase subunit I/STV1
MAITKMKKIRIITPRTEVENVLREVILLGCVEISSPEDLLSDQELAELVAEEMFELESHGASPVCIPMLATATTVLFSGWLPSWAEPGLEQVLSQYTCSWESALPSPEEQESAPVILRNPKFFGKLRLRGRKQFTPLTMLDVMPGPAERKEEEEINDAGEESSQL